MGRPASKLLLTVEEKAQLTQGYKQGKSPFSRRCHMILLKSECRTLQDIAAILSTNSGAVSGWVKRYKTEGMEGLKTKSGQGRKPILNLVEDRAQVKAMVQKERQRLKQVKEELEGQLDKSFSLRTLQRFLKKSTVVGSESA